MKDADNDDYIMNTLNTFIHVPTRRAHHNNGYENICRKGTVKLFYCFLNVFETEVPSQDRLLQILLRVCHEYIDITPNLQIRYVMNIQCRDKWKSYKYH